MKNWKTTATGLITAFGYAFIAKLQGGLTAKDAAIAAGIAVLGMFAKDFNVTHAAPASEEQQS